MNCLALMSNMSHLNLEDAQKEAKDGFDGGTRWLRQSEGILEDYRYRKYFVDCLSHEIRSLIAQRAPDVRSLVCDILWSKATYVAKAYSLNDAYLRAVSKLLKEQRVGGPEDVESLLTLLAESILLVNLIAVPITDRKIKGWDKQRGPPALRESDYHKAVVCTEDVKTLGVNLMLASKK